MVSDGHPIEGRPGRVTRPRFPGSALGGPISSTLEHARRLLPHADFRVARLEDELPTGPFDVVVSALAVHHLDARHKADLFVRVARIVAPRGRFILGDVIVPDDPEDVVTPIDGEYDQPSTIGEQLLWLTNAGFVAHTAWIDRDLAVLVGDLPPG